MNLFCGIDPGQRNQGIAIINENDVIVYLVDGGDNFPKEYIGNTVPDILKNSYQYEVLEKALTTVGVENIKMVVMEGANYSPKANVQPISIGSIHGQNQIQIFEKGINFAIISPRSIQLAIHNTSSNITKTQTRQRVEKIFHLEKGSFGKKTDLGPWTSNKTDALAMAYLAKKLYLLMTSNVELTKGEEIVFLSKTKTKHKQKRNQYYYSIRGLVYNINKKLFIFDREKNLLVPKKDETLRQLYQRSITQ